MFTKTFGVGFPCDVCGGKHSSTYSCKACGAWVCEAHAVIEVVPRPYEMPSKTVRCKGCDVETKK